MHANQACQVVRYGMITVCTVRTVLVQLRRTTVIVTPYFTVITVNYGTVYGTVPSWHCQCKNGLRKASLPQTPPIFAPQCAPPMCWRHTMLPWTTLSWIGAASARGLPLPVQFWPQNGPSAPTLPISTSRMLLSCVDATQCFPGRPWGWVEAASAWGKGPAVACVETQNRTQYLVPVR